MSESLHRVTFGGLVRSEWIKLWSLRSTWWLYGSAIVLFAGIAALASATQDAWADSYSNPAVANVTYSPGLDADSMLRAALGAQLLAWLAPALTFGQLLVSVLGVLGGAGEYQTGMIRSTFAADPRRLGSLGAKGVVSFVASALVGLVAIAVATGITVLVLEGKGWPLRLDDGYVWRSAASAVGYLGFAGLFGVLVGAIIRVQAGAIPAAIGIVLILPPVVNLLALVTHLGWLENIGAFLPSSLGNTISDYPSAEVSAIGVDPSQIDGYNPPPGPWITPIHDGVDPTTGQPDPSLDSGRVTVGPAAAAIALVGWLVAGWIAAAALTRRRDV